jgi:hypothetical protein
MVQVEEGRVIVNTIYNGIGKSQSDRDPEGELGKEFFIEVMESQGRLGEIRHPEDACPQTSGLLLEHAVVDLPDFHC